MNNKPTTEQLLRQRLVELTERYLELADDNSEHWYNLFNEWEIQYKKLERVPLDLEELKSNLLPDGRSLPSFVAEFERKIIIEAMERSKWKKTQAAILLGLTRRVLGYKIKILGIEDVEDDLDNIVNEPSSTNK